MREEIIIINQKLDTIILIVKSIEKKALNEDKELKQWLSKEEVISYLRISPSTYYDWKKRGYLKPSSILGEDRYLVADLNAFVASMGNRERTEFNDKKGASNRS